MTPNFHLWLIPLLPLAGAALNGLLGRNFSKRLVAFFGLLFVAASLGVVWWVAIRFWSLPQAGPHTEVLAPWIMAGSFSAHFAFYLDQLSLVMILVVTNVGFLIHVYSVGYMWEEGGFYRYFSYLNLFMFFMLTLVLANNYLLMFIGWEGVGLASYLLIGFFFVRDSAASAGKKAFIVNRIGDFGFLIALFLLIQHFGSLDFDKVFPAISGLPVETTGAGLLTAIGLLMLAGACGKSAQIPLYVWLPDAMEGPTPVSSLIHAATMVTAGVYMVARSNVIFDHAPDALMAVAIVGVITALFAAIIGMAQNDIKKVLAYSTISQLGYMFLACGVGAFSAGIFHLMTHAFFKGLLFLAAGSVIHALGGEQDMRYMGGLRKEIPWTFWTMTAATLAIAGIPFFSGFFSKDEILWKSLSSPYGGRAYWALGVFTALLTSFYMFRLWFMTFFGEYRGSGSHGYEHAGHAHPTPASAKDVLAEIVVPGEFVSTVMSNIIERNGMVVSFEERGGMTTLTASVPAAKMAHYEEWLRAHTNSRGTWSERAPEKKGKAEVLVRPLAMEQNHRTHIHESPKVMLAPMVILAILAVFGGYIGVPEALRGHNRFEHFLAPVFGGAHTSGQEAAVVAAARLSEIMATVVSIVMAFLGLFFAWLLYSKKRDWPGRIAASLGWLYNTVRDKFYVDEIYQAVIVAPLVKGSALVLWRGVDVAGIDATADDSAETARSLSDKFRHMQSGNVRSYAAWIAVGAAVAIAYMIWMGVR
ncbi:MAG TPA: NADH-quinone oxidoreductase subunit L [Terriglobales bacterium]|nr:NADH-quinone oxidoreductase subunit L [Terriglobales bacterium]